MYTNTGYIMMLMESHGSIELLNGRISLVENESWKSPSESASQEDERWGVAVVVKSMEVKFHPSRFQR